MNIIIRKAAEPDFEAILLLIKEFAIFQKTPDKVSITLDEMIENGSLFQCFVAETADKNIVGFASFFFAYYSWSGKAIYLDDLYVINSFRKHGIGKMLLHQIIELAKNSACKKVRWQVSKWNSNAIEFYQKMSAAVDETEINCDLALAD
ncbi:GNAT family N-acetyltransferase [Ferruginibacter paludis]|uniref:GNAT family N-acetyltransferase n=1 Tax=Ferruginibacter paludis TaxID=1310417 RepID=UPI0025B51C02|nr:GNAT family N-acetyltransferase [Ferruginibacter paludis]MDN3655215.1 GNAT family N-acetyltransferase [Ferruginibacter paludis]